MSQFCFCFFEAKHPNYRRSTKTVFLTLKGTMSTHVLFIYLPPGMYSSKLLFIVRALHIFNIDVEVF